MNPHLAHHPVPASTCPRCGRTNECSPARSGRFDVTCWCSSATIDREALLGLGSAARTYACLCQACVESLRPVPHP